MARNKIVYRGTTYDRLAAGTVYLSKSLLGDELEPNTLSVTVETESKALLSFEIDDPVTYFYQDNKRGTFYLQSVTQVAWNKYDLYATSAIGLLLKRVHRGGIYSGTSAESLLSSICGPIPFRMQTRFSSSKLYGWLPYVKPPASSARDNFMKVLFALGATVTEDLDGALKIEELWDGVSGDAQKNRMGQGASVVREGKVTSVSLIEHQWVQGGEQTDLFEGTAAQGTEIVFDEPMYNLMASGFSILERGANYAKLSAGSGTLRGTAYVHNTRLIETKILNSSTENVISVEDQTLISLVNSSGAAKRLANYYKCLETIDAPLVYNLENPGELLTTYHPFDKTNVSACIKTEEITMSNKLKSQSTLLVGFTPIRQEGSESYEYHVVLTGSGTWTVPEGTTSVRAVLIGAGGAGFDGSPGGDSTETWEGDEIKTTRINLTAPTTSANDSSNVSNRGAGTPGNGGAGGAAGTPGKVYEVTFSPSNGSRISYSCGSKGTSNGALGGATTFGSYSSNSGSTSSAGYTDIITGITYAKSGDSGADGGKGGSGADGESVGGVSGGKQEPSGSATRSDSDTQRRSNISMDIDATANFSLGASGGGGAGGNSGNNLGTPGGDAEVGSVRLSITTGYINAFVYPNKGGTGGDGADGADASVYGCSGSGAGGGGGAGGDSSASSNVSAQYYVYNITIETRTDFAINNNAGGAAVRKGGAGGKGGSGADGCIILYYGVTTPVQDGQLKDKNGLMLLDKYGRRLIV
ncbi:hypothetical protein [Clostridium phoceensis]|uniref:hypothetical protein n=1 Tax=Clostridium phoceensis TaxID=1650661 RepID=UPI002E777324|nr:hypothetical protein [Clostridium phoceensis]